MKTAAVCKCASAIMKWNEFQFDIHRLLYCWLQCVNDNQSSSTLCNLLNIRDGRLSGPAIRIRLVKSASVWIVCGTAGWIFMKYSTPFCTYSYFVFLSLLVSAAKILWWSLSAAAGSVLWRQLQPPIRFPAHPLSAVYDFCPRFIPLMQETLLQHAVLTLDASQK